MVSNGQHKQAGNGAGTIPVAAVAAPADAPVKSIATVFGEIVWLMSASPVFKQFTVGDLEWLVMPPILTRQFRMFYDGERPVGVVLHAMLTAEAEARIEAGAPTMRVSDWNAGDRPWIIQCIAPFGGDEAMIEDTVKAVFAEQAVKLRKLAQ